MGKNQRIPANALDRQRNFVLGGRLFLGCVDWIKEVSEEIKFSKTNGAVPVGGTALFFIVNVIVGVVAPFLAKCYTVA